jgi:adenylosuccinate lyase
MSEEIKEANQAVEKVASRSNDITQILDVIRTISEQTNLLALNAAIEAARAGDHGRGFAVVADEVRALASKTRSSTDDISSLIDSLLSEVGNASTVIEKGVVRAETAVDETSTAFDALHSVVVKVDEITNQITHIATAAEEQSLVTEEINRNLTIISDAASQLSDLSAQIKICSGSLNKIANDIKWLSSGPMAGIGELKLPSNEPGSSIMPGKVNPTQCEAVNMVHAQILGNDMTIGFSGSNGNFELNTYRPVVASAIHESISLLSEVSQSFALHAIKGLSANKKKIKENLNKSLMLVTALVPEIGYEKSAEIAKKALKENISLKESAKKLNYLSEKEFDKIIKPELMIFPKKI